MCIFLQMDVLLYSKFSHQSNKLLVQLEKTPDLISSLNIVCIDNKKIRDKIINDEKVKIKVLPCLIRLNEETGNFDIFEGSNAFDFFTKLQQKIFENEKEKLEREQLEREQLEREQLEREQLEREQLEREKLEREKLEREKLEQARKNSQQFKASNMNIIQEAKRQEQLRQQDQQNKEVVSVKDVEKHVSFTPIEDLEDLEDNSINTYTHVNKTENSNFSEREKIDKVFSTQKSGSLLSKAMQMQKERS